MERSRAVRRRRWYRGGICGRRPIQSGPRHDGSAEQRRGGDFWWDPGRKWLGLDGLERRRAVERTVPQARKWASTTTTATGNQDNFAFNGADQLRCNNASLLSLRGLVAGVAGQRLTVLSVGTGQVDLVNQDTNSSAANRLINGVAGTISLAAGSGRAILEYDGDTQRWRVIEHEQGAWITPAFNAGDYTAIGSMTWTVGSGDVSACAYYLKGRMLTLSFIINTSTVGGTVNTELRRTIPGGFTCQTNCTGAFRVQPGNNVWGMSWWLAISGTNYISFWATPAAANWTAASNNIYVQGIVTIEVV
jgi:hypothetical protein